MLLDSRQHFRSFYAFIKIEMVPIELLLVHLCVSIALCSSDTHWNAKHCVHVHLRTTPAPQECAVCVSRGLETQAHNFLSQKTELFVRPPNTWSYSLRYSVRTSHCITIEVSPHGHRVQCVVCGVCTRDLLECSLCVDRKTFPFNL